MGHRLLNIPRMDTVVGSLSGGCWGGETFWTQGAGRVLRSLPGKNKPTVILYQDETNEEFFEKQVKRAVKSLRTLSADPKAIRVVTATPLAV